MQMKKEKPAKSTLLLAQLIWEFSKQLHRYICQFVHNLSQNNSVFTFKKSSNSAKSIIQLYVFVFLAYFATAGYEVSKVK